MTILLATCRQQLQKGDWNLNLKLKKQHLRKVCFYLHTEESRCHWNWFKGFNSTGSFPNHHQNCWSKERMFPERTKSLTCLMATDRSVCCCTVRDRHCKQNKTQFTTVCNEYAFLSDFREKENNPKGQKTCHWKRATLHSLIHRGTAQISCCIHTFFFFLTSLKWIIWKKQLLPTSPPLLGICRALFQDLSPSRSGREQHIRKQTFNKTNFTFWLC